MFGSATKDTSGTVNMSTIMCVFDQTIGLVSRVFTDGPGDRGSIPGQVIPKTQKTLLDASLLNTQHYKVRIKGKVEQSRERSSALPPVHPRLRLPTFLTGVQKPQMRYFRGLCTLWNARPGWPSWNME